MPRTMPDSFLRRTKIIVSIRGLTNGEVSIIFITVLLLLSCFTCLLHDSYFREFLSQSPVGSHLRSTCRVAAQQVRP